MNHDKITKFIVNLVKVEIFFLYIFNENFINTKV